MSARGNSLFGHSSFFRSSNDSLGKKININLLVSMNGLLHDMSNGNMSSKLFHSSVPYELQFKMDRHQLGISYMRNKKNDKEQVNGVEYTTDARKYRFHLNYMRDFSKHKNLVLQAGLGYYYKKHDTLDVLYTSIENPYTHRYTKENAVAGVFRIGINIGKFIGLQLESQLYYGWNKYQYKAVYPLTPSQNNSYQRRGNSSYFFMPSNLFLRIKII